ncbi:MAG: hypothetical protein AB7Q37_06825 [Pyrinomonadaceae bacterium]
MKLAYRVLIATLVLLVFVFAASAQTIKNAKSEKDARNTAPTVGTGGSMGGPTGLFTVYDGQVLRRGEFTFSGAYSNYDRDPGDVDIMELPVSFQVGVTDYFELFFNTDAYRGIKVNSPANLSSFYLPNSQLVIGGVLQSGPAIVLAPNGPGAGPLKGLSIYRPTGTQPYILFPFVGGTAGSFGLPFSGPSFGFPAGTNATLGPPTAGGDGADNFPGIGSPFGSILPGVVFQTACSNGAAQCPAIASSPSVFSSRPIYLPDAPFINRRYGESAFNTFTFGGKVRFTNVNNPVGVGIVAYYRANYDNAGSFGGFNQMLGGSSAGSNRGDLGGFLFLDARVARWMNVSGNVGYHWNGDVRGDFPGGTFTLLDRPDEFLVAGGIDFPVNKYFQPIVEGRVLRYVGGRTPNAYEQHPIDFLAGARIHVNRFFGIGFAYRMNVNQQDSDSFDEDSSRSHSVVLPCNNFGSTFGTQGEGCSPVTVTRSIAGLPPGFRASSDPHGAIFQVWAGRRNPRQGEIENKWANVTALSVSDSEIVLPCPAGTRAPEGTCNDSTTVNVNTTAVDPENDVLTYNYTVSGGRIIGTGANVQWDLSGLQPGSYTITAGVDDGCGLCGQTQTQTVRIVECPNCTRPCECATISVTGPAGITQPGDAMTFTATVSGGTASNLTYNWTVTAGTIESGQGTPSITVRTTRAMANTSVTATVDVGGQDPACDCPRTDSETGGVAPNPQPVLIDEFGKLPNDDIRGRLDLFFAELSNNPNNQGYIINYGDDRDVAARERLINNHIAFRNFDRSRITLVRGGTHESGEVYTKFYRIPPGAENPAP